MQKPVGRGVEAMHKSASSRWRRPLWFVISSSFLFSIYIFMYLYRYSSSGIVHNKGVSWFTTQDTSPIQIANSILYHHNIGAGHGKGSVSVTGRVKKLKIDKKSTAGRRQVQKLKIREKLTGGGGRSQKSVSSDKDEEPDGVTENEDKNRGDDATEDDNSDSSGVAANEEEEEQVTKNGEEAINKLPVSDDEATGSVRDENAEEEKHIDAAENGEGADRDAGDENENESSARDATTRENAEEIDADDENGKQSSARDSRTRAKETDAAKRVAEKLPGDEENENIHHARNRVKRSANKLHVGHRKGYVGIRKKAKDVDEVDAEKQSSIKDARSRENGEEANEIDAEENHRKGSVREVGIREVVKEESIGASPDEYPFGDVNPKQSPVVIREKIDAAVQRKERKRMPDKSPTANKNLEHGHGKNKHGKKKPVAHGGGKRPANSVKVHQNKVELKDVKKLEEEGLNQRPEGEIAMERRERKTRDHTCDGKYIYIHDLPGRFNEDMIKNCRSLSKWFDFCPYVANLGLGPQLNTHRQEFSPGGWFDTNQFALEVIFHQRMKQYKCLTRDSSKASAIYVPYYAGLDVSRYLWYDRSLKDSGSMDLARWLRDQLEWERMWGRDHFFVAGRITWDFRREGDNMRNWGNKLMFMPESKNMTILTIESSPWNRNDFGIPYPTYFHPKNDLEISEWQKKLRKMKRKYLFSFAGAPRPNLKNSIRGEIISQCQAARRKCKLLECARGNKCYQPVDVMQMFESSVFCLQPPGDSFTRRSTFDAILAGCIPVFFHPGSAYVQYIWHFPKDYNKYSVWIPGTDVKDGRVSIEKVLRDIPRRRVAVMRDQLIRLIPKIVYADPGSRLETQEDAFDIAVKGVLERIKKSRMDMEQGNNFTFGVNEENAWKFYAYGMQRKHPWDGLFDRSRNSYNQEE